MTEAQRLEIRKAKAQHKESLKNKVMYLESRDILVNHLLKSPTPEWGSVKLSLVNW